MASTCFSYSFSLARLRAICSLTFLKVEVLISDEMLTMLFVSISSGFNWIEEGKEAR